MAWEETWAFSLSPSIVCFYGQVRLPFHAGDTCLYADCGEEDTYQIELESWACLTGHRCVEVLKVFYFDAFEIPLIEKRTAE